MSILKILFPWCTRVVCVIITIPFLTLFERKVLSYVQLRKGPKKVRVLGLLQPIADGAKLVFKQGIFPSWRNITIYLMAPLIRFVLMLVMWALFPFSFMGYSIRLRVLLFFGVSSLKVYTLFFSGWSRKSKYSLLGAFRGVAQLISYEVVILTIFFFFTVFKFSLKLRNFEKTIWFFFFFFFFLVFFIFLF